MKQALFGLAESQAQAASIVDQLKVAGIASEDVSVLSSNHVGIRHFAHEQHTKAPEGATIGASAGIVLGAAFGWLIAIGMLTIPGLGPLAAAGPIIAALAGAGGGAVAGGVIGSVIGVQIQKFEALQYDDKMHGGNILISVNTEDRAERDRAKGIFKHAGSVTAAENVVDHAHGQPSASTPVA